MNIRRKQSFARIFASVLSVSVIFGCVASLIRPQVKPTEEKLNQPTVIYLVITPSSPPTVAQPTPTLTPVAQPTTSSQQSNEKPIIVCYEDDSCQFGYIAKITIMGQPKSAYTFDRESEGHSEGYSGFLDSEGKAYLTLESGKWQLTSEFRKGDINVVSGKDITVSIAK